MKKYLCLIFVALCLTSGTAFGLGKFRAPAATGFALRDPILNHHQATAAHEHMFLGSTDLPQMATPESATAEDLIGRGTNMDNPDDTAAYWIPNLVFISGPKAGEPVPLKKFFAYYRDFQGDRFGEATPYPVDMRIVSDRMNWTCGGAPVSNIPAANCTPGDILVGHIDFPTCWNGQLTDKDAVGDTSDNVHLRFVYRKACPAGFDIKLPELRMTVRWIYGGNGSDIALSSDLVARAAGNPVKAGETFHGDFWNTWVPTGGVHGGLAGMVRRCINRSSPPSWCNN